VVASKTNFDRRSHSVNLDSPSRLREQD
jgi:hypothetical protein